MKDNFKSIPRNQESLKLILKIEVGGNLRTLKIANLMKLKQN